MTTPYVSERDHRFEYAGDAIRHIEDINCIHGCTRAVDPTPEYPGGSCDILGVLSIGDGTPVPELDDQGHQIVCLARDPLPPRPPRPPTERRDDEVPLW